MLRQLQTDQKLIANLVKSLKSTKTKSHHVSPKKPRHSVGISTVSGKGFSRWSYHWHGRGRFALTIRTRRNGTWSWSFRSITEVTAATSTATTSTKVRSALAPVTIVVAPVTIVVPPVIAPVIAPIALAPVTVVAFAPVLATLKVEGSQVRSCILTSCNGLCILLNFPIYYGDIYIYVYMWLQIKYHVYTYYIIFHICVLCIFLRYTPIQVLEDTVVCSTITQILIQLCSLALAQVVATVCQGHPFLQPRVVVEPRRVRPVPVEVLCSWHWKQDLGALQGPHGYHWHGTFGSRSPPWTAEMTPRK